MGLDGHFSGAQFAGDLLVQQARNDQGENLAFPWTQGSEPFPELERFRSLPTEVVITQQSLSDGAEQFLRTKRLRQKVRRPSLHCPHTLGDVTVSREEDDGHLIV